MKSIELNHVILFHRKIVLRTGGSDGIRDISLIQSALDRGFASFDGEDLHKEPIDKISAITHSLISNHGFVDGNKRIGVAVMLLLLELNQIKVQYTQKDLIELGLKVAEGKMNEEDIKAWINNHVKND